MSLEHLFFGSVVIFGCGWAAVAYLYFFKVIPAVKRKRGWKTVFEAGLQLNLAGHIRDYGLIAKNENSKDMLRIFYLLNVLIVVSVAAVLTALIFSVL